MVNRDAGVIFLGREMFCIARNAVIKEPMPYAYIACSASPTHEGRLRAHLATVYAYLIMQT